jgi:hypothetical protein
MKDSAWHVVEIASVGTMSLPFFWAWGMAMDDGRKDKGWNDRMTWMVGGFRYLYLVWAVIVASCMVLGEEVSAFASRTLPQWEWGAIDARDFFAGLMDTCCDVLQPFLVLGSCQQVHHAWISCAQKGASPKAVTLLGCRAAPDRVGFLPLAKLDSPESRSRPENVMARNCR